MSSLNSTTGRADAGRKGGLTTKRKMSPDYYRKIGQKGGKARGRKALISKADEALHAILP